MFYYSVGSFCCSLHHTKSFHKYNTVNKHYVKKKPTNSHKIIFIHLYTIGHFDRTSEDG